MMIVKLLLGLAAAAGVVAQPSVVCAQAAMPPSETADVNQDIKLESPVAEFQRDALDKLLQRARELAGDDEGKFTMLLREGLKRLPQQIERKERSFAQGDANAVIANLDSIAREPSELEKDPALQAAVMSAIAQAKEFGIRMVGASPVKNPMERLATVAIFDSAEPVGCSGVIVAPGAVLTAAHCVCDFNLTGMPRRIVFGNDVKTPLATAHTIPGQTRIFPSTSTASVYCDDYKRFAANGHGRVCHRDIALVRFNPASAPAGLTVPIFATKSEADASFARVGHPNHTPKPLMEVVGFGIAGMVSENGTLVFRDAGQKRFGRFEHYFDCPATMQLNCANTNSGFCFGRLEMIIQDIVHTELPTDSCGGDSGGPAYLLSAGNEWRLAGLVSRATKGGGCGQGGVYSSIYHDDVVKWLKDNNVPGFN